MWFQFLSWAQDDSISLADYGSVCVCVCPVCQHADVCLCVACAAQIATP